MAPMAVGDAEALWPLFRAVVDGRDPAAWSTLLVQLAPILTEMSRRQPVGRLRAREDTPSEIVTRVIARLHAKDHVAIRKLCAREPRPALGPWLRLLVRRAAIDYMREHPEFQRGNEERSPRWISLQSLTSSDALADPGSLAQKRRELLAFVKQAVEQAATEHASHGEDASFRLASAWQIPRIHVRRLIARGRAYLAILELVLEGHSYPEVADRLALSRREVELTVRYIEELLRVRRFGADAGCTAEASEPS